MVPWGWGVCLGARVSNEALLKPLRDDVAARDTEISLGQVALEASRQETAAAQADAHAAASAQSAAQAAQAAAESALARAAKVPNSRKKDKEAQHAR